MKAGRKDRRIAIQTLTTTRSATGAVTEAWILAHTVWAEKTHIDGGEKFTGDQLVSEAYVNFKIDYISNISPRLHRVLYEGRVYDILNTAEVGRREALNIVTKAQGM